MNRFYFKINVKPSFRSTNLFGFFSLISISATKKKKNKEKGKIHRRDRRENIFASSTDRFWEAHHQTTSSWLTSSRVRWLCLGERIAFILISILILENGKKELIDLIWKLFTNLKILILNYLRIQFDCDSTMIGHHFNDFRLCCDVLLFRCRDWTQNPWLKRYKFNSIVIVSRSVEKKTKKKNKLNQANRFPMFENNVRHFSFIKNIAEDKPYPYR